MSLRADSLYRFYRAGDDETLALRGVSLTIDQGEMVALSGPSGSGKSTLLSCLSGVDEPSGGTVWVDGERISGRTETERAALRARSIGTMAQRSDLIEHLSVLGNLRLVRGLAAPKGGTRRADELLERLGIAHRSHARPNQLSGGERVRASLAVAIANGPAVLLADEPTGELDEGNEERVLQLLREHAEGGCAVLVASHSDVVVAACDRTLRLRDGVLV